MYAKSKVTLTAVVGATLGILITPFAAIADKWTPTKMANLR